MATATHRTRRFRAIVFSLITSMLILHSRSQPGPPPQPGGCSDEVLSFSPCLPFISSPPNNLSDTPTAQCCDVYSQAYAAGQANCLCYLLRKPNLLGFPLNTTRLLSLSSLCSIKTNRFDTNRSLESFCSESQALPPLLSTTGSQLPKPNPLGYRRSPPMMSSSGNQSSIISRSHDNSTAQSEAILDVSGSSRKQINDKSFWLPLGIMIFWAHNSYVSRQEHKFVV